MLAWFPTPYPDELLYSVIARYAEVMDYPTLSALHRSLWGKLRYSSNAFFLHSVDRLVANLPRGSQHTADIFINEHSLIPYFQPFITKDLFTSLRNVMHDAYKLPKWVPSFGNDMTPRLRYCPICAKLDRTKFGETYWHRVHQLPYVEVCPFHNVWLISDKAKAYFVDNLLLQFITADPLIHDDRALDVGQDNESQIYACIAQNSVYLINSLVSSQ
jgi:hypothetical protein